jgi:glycosyltransferase involved in cell wall biosynthesis
MLPLKIAHVVLSLQAGGLEMLVHNLVRSAAMAGVPTLVCCLDERGVLADDVEAAGGRVVVLPRKAGWDVAGIFRLARFFRHEGITAVHTHSLDPMFHGGLAAWLTGVPVRIHTQHNSRLTTYGWKERLKFFLASRVFTKIVAVSEETQRGMQPYRIPALRRLTILNGIDTERFARARPTACLQASAPFVIGTVARLSPEKGVHRLLEAFAGLRAAYRRVQLHIIGEGPERARLEMQAAHLGIASSVTFLGYQQHVEAFLPAFDLFVLPSLTEGIPLALLEAMAARVAVVATAVGGVPEVVVHRESGLLVPPNDAAALQQAIVELMTQPQQRLQMAEQAGKRVRERFDLAVMAQAYRRLYLAEPPGRLWKRVVKSLLRLLPKRLMLWHGRSDRPEIALTFDDGPDPIYTPQILDLLQQYGARATFFLLGVQMQKEPKLVERMLREGHEIGNHSFTHPAFDHLSWQAARREIAQTQEVIKDMQGRPCRLFRPPGGKLCLSSVFGAWLKGMTIAMWSVDLKDCLAQRTEDIAAALAMQPIRPGDIVLYHGDSPVALAALPAVLEAALRDGYKAVPLSQMLECRS